MAEIGLYLNCTRCGEWCPYDERVDDPAGVVRCAKCGKKHSDDSVWFVDPDDPVERDGSGRLVEAPY